MASSSSLVVLVLSTTLLSLFGVSYQQPLLSSAEQEAVYVVLESVNPTIPWRSLYPDDLCSSAPHGIVCDYFSGATLASDFNSSNATVPFQAKTAHITELSFGYVSDYTPNPPCAPNSNLNPLLFTSFKYLRKLFFYKCFTEMPVPFPDNVPCDFGSSLEEMVFIENPSMVGSLRGIIGNFTNLRRLILTGNGVYGNVPDRVGGLMGLEEITLSRNKLTGGFLSSLTNLKKLRILDLSQNEFDGIISEEMGNLTQLLKLDLSHNGFSGKIPESFCFLQSLEFLDLSFNGFDKFDVALFLGRMPQLKEAYFSAESRLGE